MLHSSLCFCVCVCVCARVMHTHTHTHTATFFVLGGAHARKKCARAAHQTPKTKRTIVLVLVARTRTRTRTHTHTLCVCACVHACVCVCALAPFRANIMASDVPHRHKRPRTNNRRAPTRIYIYMYKDWCTRVLLRSCRQRWTVEIRALACTHLPI